MNAEMINIDEWLKTIKLSLNYKKTEYMVINMPKGENSSFKINICNVEIVQKELIRYLGILIDNKLSWTPHIFIQRSKLSSGLWALTNLGRYQYLDTTIMKCLYYTVIYPHLQYCALAWGQASLTALKILQNKALRIIIHTPRRISAKPLYFSLQMLKFEDIVKLQIAKLMHQCSNKIVPMHYFDLVQVDRTHKYNTRHVFHANFKQLHVRTELDKKTIYFIGPKLWSKIPSQTPWYSLI